MCGWCAPAFSYVALELPSSVNGLAATLAQDPQLTAQVFHRDRYAADTMIGSASISMEPLMTEPWVDGYAPVYSSSVQDSDERLSSSKFGEGKFIGRHNLGVEGKAMSLLRDPELFHGIQSSHAASFFPGLSSVSCYFSYRDIFFKGQATPLISLKGGVFHPRLVAGMKTPLPFRRSYLIVESELTHSLKWKQDGLCRSLELPPLSHRNSHAFPGRTNRRFPLARRSKQKQVFQFREQEVQEKDEIKVFITPNSPLEQPAIIPLIPMNIGNLYFPSTNPSLSMPLTISSVLLLVHFVTKNGGGNSVPNAWQSLVEPIHDFVPNLVNEQIGGLSGNVKQKFSPRISVTFTSSSFRNPQVGSQRNGLHFSSFSSPAGVPLPLAPPSVLPELIPHCSRASSSGIRLSANMMAGHSSVRISSGSARTMPWGREQNEASLIPPANRCAGTLSRKEWAGGSTGFTVPCGGYPIEPLVGGAGVPPMNNRGGIAVKQPFYRKKWGSRPLPPIHIAVPEVLASAILYMRKRSWDKLWGAEPGTPPPGGLLRTSNSKNKATNHDGSCVLLSIMVPDKAECFVLQLALLITHPFRACYGLYEKGNGSEQESRVGLKDDRITGNSEGARAANMPWAQLICGRDHWTESKKERDFPMLLANYLLNPLRSGRNGAIRRPSTPSDSYGSTTRHRTGRPILCEVLVDPEVRSNGTGGESRESHSLGSDTSPPPFPGAAGTDLNLSIPKLERSCAYHLVPCVTFLRMLGGDPGGWLCQRSRCGQLRKAELFGSL
eukprot:Gb_25148 [translate_table: standard]